MIEGVFLVQSVLLFSLGFLSAAFLALIAAPAIWGRAVALTKKRIEASVPLTLNEVQADKDQLRAEFAMSTRRLELSIKKFKEKITHQMLEITENRNELVRLTKEQGENRQMIELLEAQAAQLREELKVKQAALEQTQKEQQEAKKALLTTSRDFARANIQLQNASEIADSRKIELVARDTEIGTLSDKLTESRSQQKELRHFSRELELQNKSLTESLKQERKRFADIEKKSERLLTQLSDREEKLLRSEKELVLVREQFRSKALTGHDVDESSVAADEVRMSLEVQVGELNARLASLLNNAKGGDVEKAFRKLEEDRARLSSQVRALTAEKKLFEERLAQTHLTAASEWTDERGDTALLREQISDVAAEVVRMIAALEGPNSPIMAALNSNAPPEEIDLSVEANTKPLSLADRVKALQRAASTGS